VVRLPGALAPVYRRDPRAEAEVRVRLAGDTVAAVVVAGGRTTADTAVVGPSVAWSLVLPLARVNGPERLPLTGLYLAALLAPGGYWLWWASVGAGARRRAALGAALATALAGGLTVVPAAGGLTGATAAEWGLALAALAGGGRLARRRARRRAPASVATRAQPGGRPPCSAPPPPGSFDACTHSPLPSTPGSPSSGS
jgi:hypothetical protein